MAKGDGIEERLIEFAVRIIALCTKLSPTAADRHIANRSIQTTRSNLR